MRDHFSAPWCKRINAMTVIITATLTELESIPGVGEALAKHIVAGRPYASVDELEKVSGIGPKSLQELRPYVKVEGEMEKLR
jgi:DNA uptake protein ComE-like DNA-binding protein